jgi:hypothetical protein
VGICPPLKKKVRLEKTSKELRKKKEIREKG